MRATFSVALLVVAGYLLLLVGCATEPAAVPPATAQANGPQQARVPDTAVTDPVPDEHPQPETSPAPDDAASPPDQDQTFEVTEEVYERTFGEIEATIAELNSVIERRDYQRWLTYLTAAYRDTYSDPQTLREISRMPILQRNEIQLQSLRDYFEWVVGPSRANARLDDLRFLNDDHVEAIMLIGDRSVILYRLRNVDGRWKVDLF